ncbi:hypothetical protein CB1_000692037 [Camelus ferus]|nr:hypothetical protein CB1_000692037 [Camelus ferus]
MIGEGTGHWIQSLETLIGLAHHNLHITVPQWLSEPYIRGPGSALAFRYRCPSLTRSPVVGDVGDGSGSQGLLCALRHHTCHPVNGQGVGTWEEKAKTPLKRCGYGFGAGKPKEEEGRTLRKKSQLWSSGMPAGRQKMPCSFLGEKDPVACQTWRSGSISLRDPDPDPLAIWSVTLQDDLQLRKSICM